MVAPRRDNTSLVGIRCKWEAAAQATTKEKDIQVTLALF